MKKRIIIDILFTVYILILLRITVFRSGIGSHELFNGKINIVPFADLINTFSTSLVSFIYLFAGNIIWFVPFGFYLRKIKFCKTIKIAVWSFCLSLSIEIMQYIFGVGVSEIDDLILNTVGALIGIFAAFLFNKIKLKFSASRTKSRRTKQTQHIP